MTTKSSFAISKRFALLAVALLAVFVGTGMFRTDDAKAADAAVSATSGNVFTPNDVTIYVGDKVNVTRTGGSHTVTSPVGQTPAFDFAVNATTTTGSTPVFTATGTYYFYCNPHTNWNTASVAEIASLWNTSGNMVTRVTVTNAPVADTTAPVISAVAASPNPTNGAGTVSLTATATDATGIASARYRIDGGTAVAMTVAGSSLSATINVSALALGLHTLEVQATDSTATGFISAWTALSGGLNVTAVPAGSKPATVEIVGGSLSQETSGVTLSAVTLGGANTESSGAPATPWSATDARGSGAGWNVTVSCSNFAGSAGGSIPYTNFKIALAQAAIISSAGATAAPTTGAATATPFSATPLKLLTATGPAGMGSYTYTPNFVLTVPAAATPGTYTANMTITITSGP